SCRETNDRGLVARYGQQPEGRCHEIRADCIFAKLLKSLQRMKPTKSLKVTRDLHRCDPLLRAVAGTCVPRRGDDIRETLGVQASGSNLDDTLNPTEELTAKPAKSYSIRRD
ncbi:MAG: hypothetical protein JWQ49_4996, partial [Edaphobacter sp.]|nr:hypothetical protein [Edaphobacter sp.]